MSVLKTITSTLVSGSASGPLSGMVSDKFPSGGLMFPLNLTGPEQGHFIRFNIVEVDGAKFKSDTPNRPSQSDAEGNPLGNMIAGGIGAAIGGQAGGIVGGLLGGVIADVAGSAANKLGINKAISSVSDAIGDVTGSITDEIPLVKDALQGLGGFPGSIGGIAQALGQAKMPRKESVGDILLFVPMAVSASYGNKWTGEEIGFMGNAVLNGEQTWKDLKDNAGDFVSEKLGNAVGGVLGNESIAKINLKTGKIGSAVGAGSGEALAVNPHVEFFFENVDARTFNFDFKLSPRNPDESRAIQDIIKTFKYHAAPEALGSEAGRYWKYPQIFQIEYWNSDLTNKIGDCALTSIEVNYSGTADNHTFYDGQPIMVELKLSFQELDILTKDHIERGY